MGDKTESKLNKHFKNMLVNLPMGFVVQFWLLGNIIVIYDM